MQLYLQRHYKGKSLLFGSIVSLTSKVSVPKYICQNKGVDGVWTHDLRFTRPTPYHLATTPCLCLFFCQLQISWKVLSIGYRFIQKYSFRNERYFPQDQGMDGTRTHDLWFTRPTPCHLATTPLNSVFSSFLSPIFQWCRGDKMGISIQCSLEDHSTYTCLVCHTRHVLENDKNRLWWDSNPQPLNIFRIKPRSPMRYPLRHRAMRWCMQTKTSKGLPRFNKILQIICVAVSFCSRPFRNMCIFNFTEMFPPGFEPGTFRV